MEFIIGDRYGSKRSNMTRQEARTAGAILQKHAVSVKAITQPGGFVLRGVFSDRTSRVFVSVEEVLELDEKRSVEWMLRNGVTIMLGKGDD